MTGMLCSIVRAKLISVWIGPAGVGLFAIFNHALDMVSQTAQLSIRQSSVRTLSAASPSQQPSVISSIRWWCAILGLGGAAAMLAASPWLSIFSFGTTAWWWAFAALSVAVLGQVYVAGEQAIFQGRQQLKALARSAMWAVVAATALSAPMYYLMGIDSVVPTIILFPLCAVIATRALRCDPQPRLRQSHRANYAAGKEYMRLGLVMSISTIVSASVSYVFLSYLNSKSSEEVTGYYQAGYTILSQYVGVIFAALAMEYYPRLSAIAHAPGRMSVAVSHEISLILCVLTPMIVVFEACAVPVVHILYSSDYSATVPYITIGIGGAVFRAISYCMSFVIVARGDGRMYIATEASSALIFLGLSILLYSRAGLQGLGWAHVLWFVAYTLITAAAYRHYRLTIRRRAIAVCAAAIAICAAAIALRTLGWWQPLCLLPAAGALAIVARRKKRSLG